VKLPQLSSNFQEELKSFPKREPLKAQNHLNPQEALPILHHPIPIEIKRRQINITNLSFSDREFVFKEFK